MNCGIFIMKIRLNPSMRNYLKAFSIIIKNWVKHSKANKAAIIAFYTLFSFAPLIFLSATILGFFFSDNYIKDGILDQAGSMIGYEANNLINVFLDNSSSTSKISFLTIIFFYSSSVVFSELQSAMNLIWFDDRDKRSEYSKITSVLIFVQEKLYSLLVAPFIIFLFVVNAFARTILNFIINHIDNNFKVLASNINLFEIAFSMLASMLVFFLILKYLPKWKASTRNCFYASFFVTILYEIGRWLFGVYISHTELTNLYGSLSSFVVFMIWVFYLSHIFLFGVEILRYLEKERENG